MTWSDIKARVEAAGGVFTTTMDTLRDAEGAGKLGVHIRTNISKSLAGIGLGHIPIELPNNQFEQVRLYKRGTAVGDLIDQVMNPGDQNDKKLVELLCQEGTDYRSIVHRIRELVEE